MLQESLLQSVSPRPGQPEVIGLLPAHSGQITLRASHQRLAYLPQLAEIDRSFPMQVRDCVLLGFWSRTGAWGSVQPAMLRQVDSAIQAVGLQGFEQRSVGTLSSGQLQRVMFARVLVQDADLILLDEPFNAIDSKTTADLLQLVQHWHQQKRTVVAVLHDEAQVLRYFPDTLLLAREVVAWGATPQVLTPALLERARSMAESWDESAALCEVDLHAAQKACA